MKNYLILFLFNPLLGFIVAVKTNSLQVVRWGIFMYILFLGSSFIVNKGTDISHYAEIFGKAHMLWYSNGFGAVWTNFKNSFLESSELFMPTVIFIFSTFSGSTYFFTFIISIFVGIAISNVYVTIRKYYINNPSSSNNLFVLIFILVCGPSWSINGRFWLAFWVFMYIVLNYLIYKDKKWLFYALPIIFIHNGAILAITILYFYHYTHKYLWSQSLYVGMIIGAYILSTFANSFILEYSEILGGGYEKKAITYAKNVVEYQEENTGQLISETPSFIVQRDWILSNVLPILMFLSYFVLRYLKLGLVKDFYKFILLFFSFVVFFKDVPSLGGRYWLVWSYFTILFFMYITTSKISINYASKYLAYFIVLFCAYVGIRFELVQTSYWMLIGNLFLLPFFQSENMSVRDFLALIF